MELLKHIYFIGWQRKLEVSVILIIDYIHLKRQILSWTGPSTKIISFIAMRCNLLYHQHRSKLGHIFHPIPIPPHSKLYFIFCPGPAVTRFKAWYLELVLRDVTLVGSLGEEVNTDDIHWLNISSGTWVEPEYICQELFCSYLSSVFTSGNRSFHSCSLNNWKWINWKSCHLVFLITQDPRISRPYLFSDWQNIYKSLVLMCTVNVHIPASLSRDPIRKYQVLQVRKKIVLILRTNWGLILT